MPPPVFERQSGLASWSRVGFFPESGSAKDASRRQEVRFEGKCASSVKQAFSCAFCERTGCQPGRPTRAASVSTCSSYEGSTGGQKKGHAGRAPSTRKFAPGSPKRVARIYTVNALFCSCSQCQTKPKSALFGLAPGSRHRPAMPTHASPKSHCKPWDPNKTKPHPPRPAATHNADADHEIQTKRHGPKDRAPNPSQL